MHTGEIDPAPAASCAGPGVEFTFPLQMSELLPETVSFLSVSIEISISTLEIHFLFFTPRGSSWKSFKIVT
jgi:hypothetical protein